MDNVKRIAVKQHLFTNNLCLSKIVGFWIGVDYSTWKIFFVSFYLEKKINSEDVGKIEFDPQIGDWQLPSLSYYCEESNI